MQSDVCQLPRIHCDNCNAGGACQILQDSDWKAEDQRGARARTSAGKSNDDDNQGSDMPSWMFKEKSNREETKNEDSKKKPAQRKKNANHATVDVKVQVGTTEGKCVAGPVLPRAQAKKTDKIHPLKVKDTMSSVDKSTIEDLQKKESTLKNSLIELENQLSERTMLESSS